MSHLHLHAGASVASERSERGNLIYAYKHEIATLPRRVTKQYSSLNLVEIEC